MELSACGAKFIAINSLFLRNIALFENQVLLPSQSHRDDLFIENIQFPTSCSSVGAAHHSIHSNK